jgi:hypothetical protein
MMESPRPVSESGLWNLLYRFYRDRGLETWRTGRVPQRVTSNGQLADAYAGVSSAFIRELRRLGTEEVPLILEVGGGSGLSAWLMMNRLLRHSASDEEPLRFDYLLTETAETNVRAWAAMPRMRGLIEQGQFHLGVFEIDGPAPARIESLEGRSFDLTGRPVILVANYVMDSLPSDLLRIREGRVLEELIAIEGDPHADDGLPTLKGITTRFESRELAFPYTGHGGVDEVIESYRSLPGDPCIPVSMAFVSFLEPFLRSEAPFLMLAGDLAYTTEDFPSERPLIYGDYVACTANFHLISRLFERTGGTSVLAGHADDHFSVGAFIAAAGGLDFPFTREAAGLTLGCFTPHDAHNVARALESRATTLDFRMVAGWLRLARCDAHTARLCLPHLVRIVEAGEWYDPVTLRDLMLESFRSELSEATGEDSLATSIAFLFFKAGLYRDVVEFLDVALDEIGRSEVCLHMLAVASLRLGREDTVDPLLAEIVALDPHYWNGWPGPDGARSVVTDFRSIEADDCHVDHLVLRLAVSALSGIHTAEPGSGS